MHIIQAEIGIPKIKVEKIADNHSRFLLSPLPTGFGVTIGNALRRILLSSLPGAAISGVKIEGISHEYSTIKGMKESVLDLILNLKQLNFSKDSSGISMLTLETSKTGEIFAKDISCPSDVEILNPELYIATLEKGSKLKMEIRVEKGVGYTTAQQMEKDETDTQMILVDAFYSPIKKVRFDIEATRVAQMTNLDKLTLEVLTNGTISPEDAVKFASNLIQSYFNLFNAENIVIEPDFVADIKTIMEKEQEEEANKPVQESYTPIEILGFSPRTLNALINVNIGSIEQLSKCTESKLSNLRGFGKKALNEVKDALEKKGLSLSQE